MSGITYYHNYTYLESEPDKKIEDLKKSLDEKELKLKELLHKTDQRIQLLEEQVSGMTPVVDGLVNIPIGHKVTDNTSYVYIDKFTTAIEEEQIKDTCIDVSSFGLLKKLSSFDLHHITNVCLFLAPTITSKMEPFIFLENDNIEECVKCTYNTSPLFKTFIDNMIKNGTTIYWKSQVLNSAFVSTEKEPESREFCITSPELIQTPLSDFSKMKEQDKQKPNPLVKNQKPLLPEQYKLIDAIDAGHSYPIDRMESSPSRVPEKPVDPPLKNKFGKVLSSFKVLT